jgi:hypothetical protein
MVWSGSADQDSDRHQSIMSDPDPDRHQNIMEPRHTQGEKNVGFIYKKVGGGK